MKKIRTAHSKIISKSPAAALKNTCDPKDISIKALFLGTQVENGPWLESKWKELMSRWLGWRKNLYPADGSAISLSDKKSQHFKNKQEKLNVLLKRLFSLLEKESPKFTPRYMGHMVSETSMPALLGHVAALLHNPNNSSREAAKVGTLIETEAIEDLLKMVGFSDPNAMGHFTSGGTLANFEGMWRAMYRLDRTLALELYLANKSTLLKKKFHHSSLLSWGEFDSLCIEHTVQDSDLEPFSFLEIGPWNFQSEYQRITGRKFLSPVLIAPASRHYSWPKIVTLLGLGATSLRTVSLDSCGRLNIFDLQEKVEAALNEKRYILAVVSILGTTELGAVDPIDKVDSYLKKIQQERGIEIWHHVDAAFGGYFAAMMKSKGQRNCFSADVAEAISALNQAHSITLDPHKLGYVPYACGAVLCRDRQHYRVRPLAAPYLLKNNDSQWIHTIEGSRSATGAAGTWMANRALGLGQDGYGRVLEKGIRTRVRLIEMLKIFDDRISIIPSHDLNVVCISLAKSGEALSRVNARTLWVFEKFVKSPCFSVSKTSLGHDAYAELVQKFAVTKSLQIDAQQLICLRLVLMNPFTISREVKTDYLSEFCQELLHLEGKFTPS